MSETKDPTPTPTSTTPTPPVTQGTGPATPSTPPAPAAGERPPGRLSGSFPLITPERQAWFRRFAKLWGFGIFVIIVALWFSDVLLPFIFAVGVAYILAPAVNKLSRTKSGKKRMPRGLAVILCYLVLIGTMVLFF